MDIHSQIAVYQNTLKYAKSKVDFIFGIGLYMTPSNMELTVGDIPDYINKLVLATAAHDLGLNNDVQ